MRYDDRQVARSQSDGLKPGLSASVSGVNVAPCPREPMGRSMTAIEASTPRLIQTAVVGGFEGFYLGQRT